MQTELKLSTSPAVAANEQLLKVEIRSELGFSIKDELNFRIMKRSVDARSRNIKINLTVRVFLNETPDNHYPVIEYKEADLNKTVLIAGAGPAGLYAALRLLESGVKPIIVERGKTVRERRRDLAIINRDHIVNPESNYCFGEGGAGTYSDGKLYTRSNKRGDIQKILNVLIQHGASEEIGVDAHPHIFVNEEMWRSARSATSRTQLLMCPIPTEKKRGGFAIGSKIKLLLLQKRNVAP